MASRSQPLRESPLAKSACGTTATHFISTKAPLRLKPNFIEMMEIRVVGQLEEYINFP